MQNYAFSGEWIKDEFKYLDLPDARLNQRAHIMLEDLYAHPDKTLFSGARDESAAKAAYRFQKNLKTNGDNLLYSTKANRYEPRDICLI